MTKAKAPGLAPDGVAAPLFDPLGGLRVQLRTALQAVPSDAELKDLYESTSDRERVKRRLMLRAAHGLVFDKLINSPVLQTGADGSILIDVSDAEGDDLLTSLSAAIRDFSHDAERLDQGTRAERVLAPVTQEGAEGPALIPADRKIVLLALLFIELRGSAFTERKQRETAAALTGLSAGTLRTYVRNMRACEKAYKRGGAAAGLAFSKAECGFYAAERARLEARVGRGNGAMIAGLIMPALSELGAANQQVSSKPRRKG